MDVLDQYLEDLAVMATQLLHEGRTAMDFLQRDARTSDFPDLARMRSELLTEQDYQRAGGFLASGCFSEMVGIERLAAIVVCHELDDAISKLEVTRRFAPYDQRHPLFLLAPSLWLQVRDAELVEMPRTSLLGTNGHVEVPGGWARLDAFLPPRLLRWVQQDFTGLPTFIRLDPWFGADKRPLEPLWEATVRPARPGWWKTLALRNRESDGAHYVLQVTEGDLPQKMEEFWEHQIRGVISLEVHAQRDKNGYLSMMIEELTDDRRPEGRIIGRCIHLDTSANPGTDADSAELKHLDLAINMYFGESARQRREQSLSNGRVVDASVRTHLLRIEGAPFSSSAEFARQFFQSSVLLAEWVRDQFDGEATPYTAT